MSGGFGKRWADRLRRTTSGAPFVPEIDGLRFFAILPVVVHHLAERIFRALEQTGSASPADAALYAALPSGMLGVELFFVISGYIISLPMMARVRPDLRPTPKFSYRAYLLRRLMRLEPPYLIVLTACFIAVSLFTAAGLDLFTVGASAPNQSVPLWQSYAASAVYAHGVLFGSIPRLLPPAWSLEIEFQFYLTAPLIIFAILAIGRRIGGGAADILMFAAFAIALKLFAALFIPENVGRMLLSDDIEFFVVGCMLSRMAAMSPTGLSLPSGVASLLFLSGAAAALIGDHVRQSLGEIAETCILSGALACIVAGALSGGVGRYLTSLTWVHIIGGMCYTIYLLHLPLLQVGASTLWRFAPASGLLPGLLAYAALLLPMLLLASAIFFLLIEKPCMDKAWPAKLLSYLKSAVRGAPTGERPQ